MTTTVRFLRRQLAGVAALLLVIALLIVARLPGTSAASTNALAARFSFQPMSIALPSGLPQQSIRKVNKAYDRIDAWISSVGAGIAMDDIDGDGLANDLCVTDPRFDKVMVTPTPGKASGRYAPFALDPSPLPMSSTMAPMGCVPGDYNEDGRTDLLVYWWGRTPIVYLGLPGRTGLSAGSFRPTELVPNVGTTRYTGPLWNTNAAAVADFDGDGHDDIYIGDYFPDSPLLDPSMNGGVVMPDSLSRGFNGGLDHVLRWTGGTGGTAPTVSFKEQPGAIPRVAATGWVLGAAADDLDGDGLPELYMAQDFGPDRLLDNRSTPGHIDFAIVKQGHNGLIPKSKRLGNDSFKGMGVDFADLNHDGIDDMFVSNITTSFGIQESNFAFMSTAKSTSDMHEQLRDGKAAYRDDSSGLNLSWSGWGWDVKMADFDNSGELQIAQATGFVKGKTDRWPQLQEMATSNDELVRYPWWWPRVNAGDDIGGNQKLHFFAKAPDGRYVNLAPKLGLAIPVPTRGIAVGDSDGDGRLDFAVARQWDAPIFYHNVSPSTGAYLELNLFRQPVPSQAAQLLQAPGTPAIGAEVTVTTPDGRTYVSHVDGGGGHSGKRSHEVHIGLGNISGQLKVHLQWRDSTGQLHQQDMVMSAGRHTIELGTSAKEK
ncbi:MAG: CRTAC1 family protein [Frankiaceae bacterium]